MLLIVGVPKSLTVPGSITSAKYIVPNDELSANLSRIFKLALPVFKASDVVTIIVFSGTYIGIFSLPDQTSFSSPSTPILAKPIIFFFC